MAICLGFPLLDVRRVRIEGSEGPEVRIESLVLTIKNWDVHEKWEYHP